MTYTAIKDTLALRALIAAAKPECCGTGTPAGMFDRECCGRPDYPVRIDARDLAAVLDTLDLLRARVTALEQDTARLIWERDEAIITAGDAPRRAERLEEQLIDASEQAARQLVEIADWIESCREDDKNGRRVVQVFDVMASRIRKGTWRSN